MATMDVIKLHGGSPANFLDIGGGASAKEVMDGFHILDGDKNVRNIILALSPSSYLLVYRSELFSSMFLAGSFAVT